MKTALLPLTTHAKQRRKQMGITEDQIDAALRSPDMVYPVLGHPEKRHYVKGDIVVVANDNCVITVVWHKSESRDERLGTG